MVSGEEQRASTEAGPLCSLYSIFEAAEVTTRDLHGTASLWRPKGAGKDRLHAANVDFTRAVTLSKPEIDRAKWPRVHPRWQPFMLNWRTALRLMVRPPMVTPPMWVATGLLKVDEDVMQE